MPSPPLPPRIALTDDLPGYHGGSSKRSHPVHQQSSSPWLVMTVCLLLAGLAVMSWMWFQTQERSQAVARQAAISWNFSDGALEELVKTRDFAAKLDDEREKLIKLLGVAEKRHASLQGELDDWKQKHNELASSSQRALAQWTQYGKNLEDSLDSAQAKLGKTSQTLEQERLSSQEQLSQLDNQKTAAESDAAILALQKKSVEREADTLNQQTHVLSNQNGQMDAEINRLRESLRSLGFEKEAVELRNAQLVNEENVLRGKINGLEARIHALEQDKDRDKDKDKNKH